MKMRLMRRTLLALAGCILLFVWGPDEALAHRLLVEHGDNGLIAVRYDDGTPAQTALVRAYGPEGELLAEGEADGRGFFYYDPAYQVVRIVADDGMGHRAGWREGEASRWLQVPKGIRALLGVSVLAFAAAFYFYRSRIKGSRDAGSRG